MRRRELSRARGRYALDCYAAIRFAVQCSLVLPERAESADTDRAASPLSRCVTGKPGKNGDPAISRRLIKERTCRKLTDKTIRQS